MGDSDASWSLSRLPDQFGKYSLLGHLATGGMAEVYVARQGGLQGFEKIVVIKCVRGELEGDVEATGFFLDEARLVATLEHPNIAQVHEIGIVNGSYFFVMEYVHGADLRQLMETSRKRKQQLPLGDAIYIASHVCAALHHAHEKCDHDGNSLHIIHRDVSPSNVLLSHDGAVKLCDFGIAKAQNRSSETRRGVLKGKYSYMSPEQCRTQPLDRRSDVFSMGIVLYELTTLTKLFDEPSDFELMRAIVESPVPPPSSRVPGYPPELERIVMRALEKDPADRYQTAQEMQLALEDFARERKLPQSSVHLATLMGALFEKRVEAWMRAQKQGRGIEDYLMDTAVRTSNQMPVFMPIGSSDDAAATEDIEIIASPQLRERGMSTPIPRLRASIKMPAVVPEGSVADETPARRGPSKWWLAGAVLCGLAGGGTLVAERVLGGGGSSTDPAVLESAADKIGATFDQAARSAHLKADGIAATPMLRAAIETDAATMKDVVTNEYVFSMGKGEVIEIFKRQGTELESLVRLPVTGGKLPQLKGGETRVDAGDQGPVMIAGAAISGPKAAVTGVVVVGLPVDLSSVRRVLDGHVAEATIEGLGAPVPLVAHDGTRGEPIKIPLAGDWNTGHANLVATPIAKAAADLGWIPPVRYGGFGAAALLLLGYAIGFARRK
jgi:serine/threonine protein kinase